MPPNDTPMAHYYRGERNEVARHMAQSPFAAVQVDAAYLDDVELAHAYQVLPGVAQAVTVDGGVVLAQEGGGQP